MLTASFTSASLILLTVGIHFVCLRALSSILPKWLATRELVVLVTLCGVFLAHVIEIGLYAAAFYWLTNIANVGTLTGSASFTYMDYFYYSTVMYTSLGIGDVVPSEHLRIISGLETLNGLVLIGWSTSFTFLVMRRFWSFRGD